MSKSNSEINWYLPLLYGGEAKGLNDAGIQNFKRSQHLARETLQNIVDAHDPNSGGKATAEFELLSLDSGGVPGIEMLRAIFDSCFTRVTDGQSNSGIAVKDFEKGKRLLSPRRRKPIPILRIRDKNTLGLEGDDEDHRSRWYRLVRGQGTANIEGAGGGTYGIGQRAPFAFSGIRTVFYSTMLRDGSVRFMGKFILCTCEHPKKRKLTQNVGYFGSIHPRSNTCVRSITEPDLIPEFFRRSKPGTDIYIMGFTLEDLRHSVVRTVLGDFYAAILHGNLEVVIRDGENTTEITAETIDQVFADEMAATPSSDLRQARLELKALSSPEGGEPYSTTIDHIGRVHLYVIRSSGAGNQIAHMRSPRMKVYRRQSNKLKDYQAVLLVDNKEGNQYLAKLEDPGHQRWDAEEARGWSASKRAEAQKALRALKRFVNETLTEIRGQSEVDEEDIPELSKLLPVEFDDETKFRSRGTQPTDDHKDEESPREIPKSGASVLAVTRLAKKNSGTMTSDSDSGRGNDEGTATPDDEPWTGDHSGGDEEESGDRSRGGVDPGRAINAANVEFRSWQSGGRDSQVYRLALTPKWNLVGSLALRAAGEQKNFEVAILRAVDLDGGRPRLIVSMALFRKLSLTKAATQLLEVTLDSDVELSLAIVEGDR